MWADFLMKKIQEPRVKGRHDTAQVAAKAEAWEMQVRKRVLKGRYKSSTNSPDAPYFFFIFLIAFFLLKLYKNNIYNITYINIRNL